MIRKPSIKTLESAFPGKGKALRLLLDSADAVNNHPAVIEWCKQRYHEPRMHEKRMHAIDATLENYGVEYIPQGHNTKSPAILYSNSDDFYNVTIYRMNATYYVGCIANVIERGHYD